ncbi:MAG TPA: hypothetical protein PLX89_09145 [Verrucomicrobiota bacterium]|nr:hypothetical protein [Verrucomicrobiales bacterium]HRI13160.1 hypothetical protein [Verrucomicrobiota bacterium]
MNHLTALAGVAAIAALVLAPSTLAADKDSPDPKATKDKPYKLEKCIVSDEKLGEMGDPYAFGYKGQEFKLCCKHCKKDFDKDPQKYVKKLAEELKKPKK